MNSNKRKMRVLLAGLLSAAMFMSGCSGLSQQGSSPAGKSGTSAADSGSSAVSAASAAPTQEQEAATTASAADKSTSAADSGAAASGSTASESTAAAAVSGSTASESTAAAAKSASSSAEEGKGQPASGSTASESSSAQADGTAAADSASASSAAGTAAGSTSASSAAETASAAGTDTAADARNYPASPAWVTDLASAKDAQVTQLVIVEGTDMNSSAATVSMHIRGADKSWKQVFSVPGFIGRDGMCPDAEHVEGGEFTKTPIGVYRFNKAFGTADDPGCQLEYTKVDADSYWSGDDREGIPYNQLVSIKDYPDLDLESSVHLVDSAEAYKYCLNISFNEDAVPGKGSAIFLRCAAGEDTFTGGSVAIPEENMKTVMEMVHPSCAVVLDTKANLEHIAETPEKKPETEAAPVGQEYTAFDGNGNIQGKLILHSDGYYYSNDSQRYRDNGDGSYYGVDTGDTLYDYDPTNGANAVEPGDRPGAFQVWDGYGNIQGFLAPRTDSTYYTSNDGQRYQDNGDGSFYGVDTGDTLYSYDPTYYYEEETDLSPADQPGSFEITDEYGNWQGYLVPEDDGYYYSNDGQRYVDNGDGSYYGIDTGDTLYMY